MRKRVLGLAVVLALAVMAGFGLRGVISDGGGTAHAAPFTPGKPVSISVLDQHTVFLVWSTGVVTRCVLALSPGEDDLRPNPFWPGPGHLYSTCLPVALQVKSSPAGLRGRTHQSP